MIVRICWWSLRRAKGKSVATLKTEVHCEASEVRDRLRAYIDALDDGCTYYTSFVERRRYITCQGTLVGFVIVSKEPRE